MNRLRLGVMFRRHVPPGRLREFAGLVESEGLDELWVVEDCFWAGGISAAAAALAATNHLTVGLGIAPAVARNPAIVAMEFSGIASMFPGRFIAGFGHGVASWMQQIGALPNSQLAALEETIMVVDRLLRGDRVSFDGDHVYVHDAKLVFAPAAVPVILAGVTGPRSLEMTGRSADGVLLPEGSSPAYVRAAVERMGNPAAMCTVYVLFAVADDRAEAEAAVLPAVDEFAASGVDERLAKLGPVEEVVDADRVRRYAVAGTPEDCAAAIKNLQEAGAQSVVLVPQSDDQEGQIRRAAREVLPLLD